MKNKTNSNYFVTQVITFMKDSCILRTTHYATQKNTKLFY